jgi:2-polyprenyl-6-methoxyphenol hydroxylase-like FAD-dependent oxidoreductase
MLGNIIFAKPRILIYVKLNLKGDSSMKKDTNEIAIIGGGIGGLTLARILYVKGIPAKVYESDSSPNARTQGGQLDIHDYNGQIALKEANLWEEFTSIIHEGADAVRFLDTDGSILLDLPSDESNGRPEVLRGDLRKILIDSLPSDMIIWDKKVSNVQEIADGKYQVEFQDNTSITSNILIGADGAWSKVRKVLTDVKPEYKGTTFLDAYLYNVDEKYPETAHAVGQGACFALSPNKGMTAHREPNDTIHTYIQLNCTAEWIKNIDFSEKQASIDTISSQFEGWAPELLSLIQDSDTHIIPRMIYALPDKHRWTAKSGVTLIGDAAHLMAPSGEGANLAMIDAYDLANAIENNFDHIDVAIVAYEKKMFPRSEEEAKESHEALDNVLGKDSPHKLISFFKESN